MKTDLTEAKRILDKIDIIRAAYLKKYEALLMQSKPNSFKSRMAAIFGKIKSSKK